MRNNILNLLPYTGKQIFSRLTFTFLIAAQSIAARNVEITQFGAVGDAAKLNTKHYKWLSTPVPKPEVAK